MLLGDCTNATPRVITTAFQRLAKLNHAGRWRDNYGNLCGGLNRTALLYHVPFSHYRAALCRSCTAAAPRLSCRQAARCLAAAARLDGVGLRDPALLAALAARTLRSAHRLRPAAVARLLSAVARLGLRDPWLTAALATRAMHPSVLPAFAARAAARAVRAAAELTATAPGLVGPWAGGEREILVGPGAG